VTGGWRWLWGGRSGWAPMSLASSNCRVTPMGFDAAAPSLLAIGRTRQIDLIDFSPPFTSWKALHVPRFVLQAMSHEVCKIEWKNPGKSPQKSSLQCGAPSIYSGHDLHNHPIRRLSRDHPIRTLSLTCQGQ
jgi:hypothetical protein